MRIALATSPGSDLISRDDVLLAEAIEALGGVAEILNWSDASVVWSEFDLVAVRTTWDYHLNLAAFLDWVERVCLQTRLVNSHELIRWNAHKSYLNELSAKGVPTVPTQVLEGLPSPPVLSDLASERVVAKPEVGAGAQDTFVLAREDRVEIEGRVGELLERGKVLLQPYMECIESEGELSLVWIGGEVTHAIQKRPGAGDYRVQVEHGGSNERVDPAADGLALAEACVRALPCAPLFARVDAVRDEGGVLRLMELELIEPELMFEWAPESAEVLARELIGFGGG